MWSQTQCLNVVLVPGVDLAAKLNPDPGPPAFHYSGLDKTTSGTFRIQLGWIWTSLEHVITGCVGLGLGSHLVWVSTDLAKLVCNRLGSAWRIR